MSLTAQDLFKFLTDSRKLSQVDENTSLFSEGTVDSVGMVDLIMFIEKKTGITVEQSDVTLDNFDTVGRIVQFLRTKQG